LQAIVMFSWINLLITEIQRVMFSLGNYSIGVTTKNHLTSKLDIILRELNFVNFVVKTVKLISCEISKSSLIHEIKFLLCLKKIFLFAQFQI